MRRWRWRHGPSARCARGQRDAASAANTLTGTAGDDRLDGAAGADTLAGGLGGDTYVVDDAGDAVQEAPGGGFDTIETVIDLVLPANGEALVLTGAARNGTGNGLANTITGMAFDDTLDGGAGTVEWQVASAAGTGTVAANAVDFAGDVLPGGILTFATGETSRTITEDVAADLAGEFNERFAVTLANPSAGATITTASAVAVILNDDTSLSLRTQRLVLAEGNAGTTNFAFTVSRDVPGFRPRIGRAARSLAYRRHRRHIGQRRFHPHRHCALLRGSRRGALGGSGGGAGDPGQAGGNIRARAQHLPGSSGACSR